MFLIVQFAVWSFTSHLSLDLPKCVFLSGSQTELICVFYYLQCVLLSHLSHSFSGNLPTIFTDQHISCSSSLCNYVHPPATPFFFRPNISLSPFSSTIFPCLVAWNTKKNTPFNTINSVIPKVFFHNPDLLCEICFICSKNCIRCTVF